MLTTTLKKLTPLFISLALANTSLASELMQLDLDLSASGKKIQPTMYGIFFEDINFSADGGLYAELVKNRSFEFDLPMMGWSQPNTKPQGLNLNSGIAHTLNFADNKTNKNVLRVNIHNDKHYSLINDGFRGMGITQGKDYLLSFYAANVDNSIKHIHFQLIDAADKVIASTRVAPSNASWQQYSATLRATKTEPKARLKISFEGKGAIELDMISLFPKDTWKGRTKGLRADLIQMLADLKPGFFRFPGGCIIEGRTLAQRFQWKNTLGDIEQRPTMISRWNNEFSHKLTPDYFQSFGLGFYEYFQLAEDLGAEPIPVLNCGIACQFNSGEVVPLAELDSYIQDALDLIEFANGSVQTPWGKVRQTMGHPEPFNLKYIGIGNEQWGPQYIERYAIFQKVLKEKYPDIQLISSSGPFADGEQFDYAHRELKKLGADVIDEHYYSSIDWFKQNANRYDNYDRNGPKIFAGEYAVQSVATLSPNNKNSWATALAEAAFMTGLERNADIVHMTSYAPLMAHVEAWQWAPNMIWFDNLRSLPTANYAVQKLFANNRGEEVVSITANGKALIGQEELYASAVRDADNSVVIKLVNTSAADKTLALHAKHKALEGSATFTTLTSANMEAENSFANPNVIHPIVTKQKLKANTDVKIPAQTLLMIRVENK